MELVSHSFDLGFDRAQGLQAFSSYLVLLAVGILWFWCDLGITISLSASCSLPYHFTFIHSCVCYVTVSVWSALKDELLRRNLTYGCCWWWRNKSKPNRNWSVKHTQTATCLSLVSIVLLEKAFFWFGLLTKMLTKTFTTKLAHCFVFASSHSNFQGQENSLRVDPLSLKKKKMVQPVRSMALASSESLDKPFLEFPFKFPFCWPVPSYSSQGCWESLLSNLGGHAQLCASFHIRLVLLWWN